MKVTTALGDIDCIGRIDGTGERCSEGSYIAFAVTDNEDHDLVRRFRISDVAAEALALDILAVTSSGKQVPTPMIMTCPSCSGRHIDEGEFATKIHHTHACQHCGMTWRPAIGPTVGVQFLPGFKNA